MFRLTGIHSKKNTRIIALLCSIAASAILLLLHTNLPIQITPLINFFIAFSVITTTLFVFSHILETKQTYYSDVANYLFDSITDYIAIKDKDGNFIYGNESVLRFYNATQAELIGKNNFDFTGNKERYDLIFKNAKSAMDTFKVQEAFESSINIVTNKIHHFHSIKIPYYDHKKELKLFIMAKDITDIIELKEESDKNKARLQHVLDVSGEGLWEWNTKTGEINNNKRWEDISGIPTSQQSFEQFVDCILEEDKLKVHTAIDELIEHNKPYNIEFRLKRPDGEIIWIWDRAIVAERDEDKHPTLLVGLALDITQEKHNQQKIHLLAYQDQLTTLSNRAQFEIDLATAIQQSQQQDSYSALLFLDLDRFKLLNDAYGHHMGDKLLTIIGQKLTKNKRNNTFIARFGGDEFTILLPTVHIDQQQALTDTKQYANQIIQSLAETVYLESDLEHVAIKYAITASLGGIIFKDHDMTPIKALKLADIALYRAKANGGNDVVILDPNTQENLNHSGELQKAIRQSIFNHDFLVFLQPKYSDKHVLLGAEALVRWEHPTLGLLAPGSFIDLAEESNLIIPIGNQVLHLACAQLKKWQSSEHTRHLEMSVNLSAKQIWQNNFIEDFLKVVESYDIDPKTLIAEVTESVFIKDMKDATEKLVKLKEFGISISLDDFGTGYSSLSYLRKLPIDELKIDRSFIQDVVTSKQAYMMVKSIIELATNFNLKVVSEGVEEKEQLLLLKELGITTFQGFYFSPPISIDDMDALIEKMHS